MVHCVDEGYTCDHASRGYRLQCVGSDSTAGWCMTSQSLIRRFSTTGAILFRIIRS